MADWSSIQNLVEAVLQGQGAQTGYSGRSQQGYWYGREVVRRNIQDFRETGAPAVYPWTAAGGSLGAVVTSNSARIFALLVDNSHASNQFWVQLFDLTSGSVTLGTTNPVVSVKAEASQTRFYAFAVPIPGQAANGGITWQATTTPAGSTTTNNTTVSAAIVYTT